MPTYQKPSVRPYGPLEALTGRAGPETSIDFIEGTDVEGFGSRNTVECDPDVSTCN